MAMTLSMGSSMNASSPMKSLTVGPRAPVPAPLMPTIPPVPALTNPPPPLPPPPPPGPAPHTPPRPPPPPPARPPVARPAPPPRGAGLPATAIDRATAFSPRRPSVGKAVASGVLAARASQGVHQQQHG